MDVRKLQQLIRKSAGDRTKLIDTLLAALDKEVAKAQRGLLQRFISDWVDKLDIDENGVVKNTLRNRRMLATVDTVFNDFVKNEGIQVAKTIVEGITKVIDFNGQYYKNLGEASVLSDIKPIVKEYMQSWLGLKGNGALEGNGYLQKTVSDVKVLGELKNLALRSVSGQQGYQALKEEVKTFIDGNKDSAGMLQRYYRNFVYDTYSQVDRATAEVYAVRLEMDYALYEGGLIKTSRKFCKERNGKVFTRDEINQFDPKVAKQPNYNPFTDLGGYGCRHHLNWIPYSVAVLFRPDLKNEE